MNILKIFNQYVVILQIKLHITYYNGVCWHLSDFALRFAHVFWHLYCHASFHCLNVIHIGICVLLVRKSHTVFVTCSCCRDRDSSSSLSMQHYFESPRRHISEPVCGTFSRENIQRREEPFWMWMVPSHGLGFKVKKRNRKKLTKAASWLHGVRQPAVLLRLHLPIMNGTLTECAKSILPSSHWFCRSTKQLMH